MGITVHWTKLSASLMRSVLKVDSTETPVILHRLSIGHMAKKKLVRTWLLCLALLKRERLISQTIVQLPVLLTTYGFPFSSFGKNFQIQVPLNDRHKEFVKGFISLKGLVGYILG